MSRTPQEQLVHFLSDLYSMELQAVAQLKTAPSMAKDPALVADFEAHLGETEQQADRVRLQLESLGEKPSAVKDAIMKLGGKAFLLFAKLQPETPGRLVAHAYSYEAMEWAGYAMLIRMAELVGDETTAGLGRDIQAQERAMMERLERGFDAAEEASHQQLGQEEMATHVRNHLTEAHALEVQSIQLLEKGVDIAEDPELAQLCRQHLDESKEQIKLLEQRLDAMGADASSIKDGALKLGALNWGLFFQAQTDTPAKLAAFAYAVEHLEIAGYELLKRTAHRANDTLTVELCDSILAEERSMADRLADSVDSSARATLGTVQE